MHTANYRTATNGAGEVGQYPLSTETLDFTQDQIRQLHELSRIVGYNRPWVLYSPSMEDEGILLYADELITIEVLEDALENDTEYSICLREKKVDIQTPDDVYKAARTYKTAYVAPKGTAGAIGLVMSRDSNNIHSEGFYTLAQLAHLNTAQDTWEVSNDTGKLILTSNDLDFEWLGRKILFTATHNAPNVPMSLDELDNAYLTTRLLDQSTKSFLQELETRHGVRYRRVFKHPDDHTDRGEEKYPNINAYGWECLPNQVIGSCKIDINPYVSKSTVSWQKGVLQSVTLTPQGSGLLLSVAQHPMMDVNKARIEISFLHHGYGTLHAETFLRDFMQPYGRHIYLGFDGSKMTRTESIIVSVISL